MAEKFTKGPWKALTNGNAYNSETVATFKDAADGWICSVYDDCDTCALPDDANANLIAAAPELYEALNKLLAVAEMTTFSDSYPAECEFANEALKRARGEQHG
ncbi:hypothetical protein [Maritalea porphyrae]|uniref:hypothetical protein n=1 Tax=Maritalea porphyrae TaxID=880732 RepID=UPI0022AF1117|nr:hypothetical protein [Maritalea porphyrae]MCZ4270929.1 hypothetical protein [Maritalea porphyrae]